MQERVPLLFRSTDDHHCIRIKGESQAEREDHRVFRFSLFWLDGDCQGCSGQAADRRSSGTRNHAHVRWHDQQIAFLLPSLENTRDVGQVRQQLGKSSSGCTAWRDDTKRPSGQAPKPLRPRADMD
ncbi:hypothetical protein D7V77_06440 [Corallococcus sp. CA041A]|nr:hypothetical protein D7V77_06440 [Corallococcus sp. CA041A]